MKPTTRRLARACRVAALCLLAAQLDAPRSAQQQPAPQRQGGEAADASRRSSSDGAMQGVDLQHTRLFRTRAPREAKSFRRHSQKFFKFTKDGLGMEVLAYGLSFGEWYSAVSEYFTIPVVAGDALYFTVFSGDGYVLALDKETGAGRWRGKADRTAFSPPAVAGGVVYLGTQAGAYFALDAATGDVIWKTEDEARAGFVSPPAVHDGVVYFTVTRKSRGRRLSGDPPRWEGTVYALDAPTGKVVWQLDVKSGLTSAVIDGGTLFVGGDSLIAVDAKTGRERWNVKGGGGVFTLAAAGGAIYVTDGDGVPRAVDAADGRLRWKADKKFRARTMLAVGNGNVYFAGKNGDLHALDAAAGQEKWRFEMRRPCGTPSLAEDFIYFNCAGEHSYALDARTGEERWKLWHAPLVTSPPVISNGVIYLLRSDGYVYALR